MRRNEEAAMANAVLNVPDISCSHCEKTITETLQPQPGVRSVRVDIPGKKVTLEYDETQFSVDQARALLAEEEYPVESVD
jgi:copper chaperone CopZ